VIGAVLVIPLLLALAAYAPLLLTAPGVVAADTKLYLYLDPWRLMSDAAYTWDIRQLGGWVPHQNVGYLWPSGPWYAVFDLLHTPDWVAQRLWLGTILALAGIGTWYLCRVLETPRHVAVVAAFAYQMSPYVLPYISRTSALLLPWAMLPFMIALTARMCRSFSWRQVLAFALAVATAGGLNATALLMVLPGPAVWLVVEWVERRIDRRTFLRLAVILSTVSIGASAWWMAGLSTQGKYGAPVLSYSETLPSTSATSTATETLRGLGYWLFYDRPGVAPLTTASQPYQTNLLVIIAGVSLVVVGLIGLGLARHRRALTTMLVGGVVLAVGAYPFGDSSPLWSFFADRPKSGVSLALRSSSRAVPLVALALAIGVGHTTANLHRRITRQQQHRQRTITSLRFVVPGMTALLLIANMPALVSGRLIDPNVSRPEQIPRAWFDAAAYLDHAYDDGSRGSVLIVPGIESHAFRWGYTVDPILPGLTRKPMITRDWLPLGSAPLMDLLYALDDSFQNGTATPDVVAPIARLLGADTVMAVNSFQYERFSTIRPERTATIINSETPGLTHLADFGEPGHNRAPTTGAGDTELGSLPDRALPEIQLYSVDSPFPAGITTHPAVISGDGTSLVDLAAAGLLDEPGTRLMSAALTGEELRAAVAEAERLIVTDGNRIRAHQWRGSQQVWGATEPLAGVVDAADIFDSRLPVFPVTSTDPRARSYVVAPQVTATATSYGALLSYRPEYRPSMAVDGDPDTAWAVGWGINPVGQLITLRSEQPIERLEPRQLASSERSITAVDVSVDGGPWTPYTLSSTIVLDTPGRAVSIRIAGIDESETASGADDPVGFSELLIPERSTPEIVQVPVDGTDVAGAGTPITYVFTRLRSDPLDPERRDPETAIRRSFDVPHDGRFVLSGRVAESDDEPPSECIDMALLDGISLSLRIDVDGRVTTCDGRDLELSAGQHTLMFDTDRTNHLVDQVVLASEISPQNASSSTPVDPDVGRVSRSIDVSSCPSTATCWVQTTDGWNTGWSATVDGVPIDAPIAGASGRNTWPVAGGTELRTTWDPQTRMWIGIAITLLTFVVLFVLSVYRRRTPMLVSMPSVATTSRAFSVGRVATTLISLITAAVLISPMWGAVAALIAVLIPRRHLLSVGLALVALAMLFLIAQQVRIGADAGFGWPSVFHRAHRPALLGLVIILVSTWCDDPRFPKRSSSTENQ